MSVLNENTLLGASGAGGYEIEQSLRFDAPNNSYLSRTFPSAGNLKTWTWSAWVKRGTFAGNQMLFSPTQNSNGIYFDSNGILTVEYNSPNYYKQTSAKYRDTGAWYHIIVVWNTPSSTAEDRIQIWVNGERVTEFSGSSIPNQNRDSYINTAVEHNIGDRASDQDMGFDGYIGEVNFIDGQALTPDSFGETGKYGEWKPTKYAGTYGTNGFYLPFEQDYTVEGFSTVVYDGNSQASHYIGGVGFQPDFIWTKQRTGNYHLLIDSVRGAVNHLYSSNTQAERTSGSPNDGIVAFNPDGYTVGYKSGWGFSNTDNTPYVSWCWDMGGTTASNTDGTITSSVRANPAYGQSIITWTPSNNSGTVGHGLDSAPELWITKNRAAADNWLTFYTVVDGTLDYMLLNLTNTAGSSSLALPTSTVFSNDGYTSSQNLVTYAFHSVSGYSKFGSYSGSGSSGKAITTGFRPAFVMVKNTTSAQGWVMVDNTRSPTNPANIILNAEDDSGESAYGTANRNIDFDANGFTIKYTAAGGTTALNASSNTYIYMAFADTREYAYWLDQSGNNNDWASKGGLTESDVMVDSPTNNFATWNPLNLPAAAVLSEGNTKLTQTSNDRGGAGTMAISSGKFYFEIYYTAGSNPEIGLAPISQSYANSGATNSTDKFLFISNNGGVRTPAWTATSATGLSSQTGISVIGFAIDADAGKTWFTNASGTYFNSGNPATGSNPQATFDSDWLTQTGGGVVPFAGIYTGTGSDIRINFGSDSSFAGAKDPQGNQDSNNIGDFHYPVPSGFLSLCSVNLPSVDVIPSEHFNTVLYTGTRQNKIISGVGLAPDLVWIKTRSTASNHALVDSVRGGGKALQPSTTSYENQYGAQDDKVTAFSSDGFSLGVDAGGYGFNDNNATYVAWNWKAGGSASSNTNGTITSSVSANPSAGFSIVSYTGTGANATVGHGLASAPEMLIVKNRDATDVWLVYHDGLASDPETDFIILNRTDAKGDVNTAWNDTAPTSTVFSLGSLADVNRNSSNLIAYCFHSVEGHSKVNSYFGNGSATDGTFVHCGFRPAYVMVKHTTVGWHWWVYDNARDTYNQTIKGLKPNHSGAEYADATYTAVDLLSNGFKWRTNEAQVNANGGKFIFLAFAETPFKFSNAR